MEKSLSLFKLFAFLLALIGGTGYCLMEKAYFIALSVVVLAIMALPEVKKAWDDLTDQAD